MPTAPGPAPRAARWLAGVVGAVGLASLSAAWLLVNGKPPGASRRRSLSEGQDCPIALFSLHGWLWAGVALVGTVVGLRVCPLFGLGVRKPSDSSC
jgi:hypothetical protein